MAESAANLTGTTRQKPSIFEVVAQENLDATIQPAVYHVARVLATYYPAKFSWLTRWFDEIFLALNFALQSQSLTTYGSSLAESFYGLERIPVQDGKPRFGPLPKRAYRLSLVFLVLLPYLRRKAEKLYEELKFNQAEGRLSDKDYEDKLRRAFMATFPFLHMTFESAVLYYNVAYMAQKSRYHNPLLKLAGVELKYDSEGKLKEMERRQAELFSWQSWNTLRRFGCSATRGGVQLLFWGLEASSYFLQCLEWWFASEHTADLTALPAPPPPPYATRMLDRSCPICCRERRNEAALSVSGYVFCYACIFRHLKEHGTCPVTGYSATVDELVRLFPPTQ